ncbi:MAG TPA: hypothetical protein PLI27_10105 [Ignavibacteriales bacterium]|nr:hypothetical protein [Ignavibacteriales bacterium]HOL82233.1 hypothetical protein [Ignavibacteriales bacterium]HOM66285.1 hypothetical protein [Ignavibacteriales bacterium]HPD68415.1 hypothetical protein [Ignavibacteriales bacterium]HPP34419.1 hypothetical protein [Ignavibacteriales bacterium]
MELIKSLNLRAKLRISFGTVIILAIINSIYFAVHLLDVKDNSQLINEQVVKPLVK